MVCLQETWAIKEPTLLGYLVFHLPAIKSYGWGRNRAGLCFLVKDHLASRISYLGSTQEVAQAMLLSWVPNIILVNIYLPPSVQISDRESYWEELSSFLFSLKSDYPEAKFMLAGDFNARLGSNQKVLKSLRFTNPTEHPCSFIDPKLNMASSFFVQLCQNYSLKILNCSNFFPDSNNFTHFSLQGNSVIDYV